MTFDRYIAELEALLAAEQYQHDFSEAAWPDIEPALTLEERAYSIMEVVATIVDLNQAAARQQGPSDNIPAVPQTAGRGNRSRVGPGSA